MKKLIDNIRKFFEELADNIARLFLRLGIRRLKDKPLSICVDDVDYVIKPYKRKHGQPLKTDTTTYWADLHKKINEPDKEASYIVLDTFESRLP